MTPLNRKGRDTTIVCGAGAIKTSHDGSWSFNQRSGACSMKKAFGVVLITTFVATASFLASGFFKPKNPVPISMETNVLISETGNYLSPLGTHRAEILETSPGQMSVQFYQDGGCGARWAFQSGSAWFLCWDSQDQLWGWKSGDDTIFVYYAAEGSIGVRSSDVGDPRFPPPEALAERLASLGGVRSLPAQAPAPS